MRTTKVGEYISEIMGAECSIGQMSESALRGVPYVLRDGYEFHLGKIMGESFVIASVEGDYSPTPKNAAKHMHLLTVALGHSVAFVFPRLPAYNRQRLVHHHVPFVVPGIHLFLPFLGADSRSKTRSNAIFAFQPSGPLSAPAQMIVLFHLQRRSLQGLRLGDVAQAAGYSPMTVSRVAAELAASGLADVRREGVRKHLEFGRRGKDLWEHALPTLRSPVRRVTCVATKLGSMIRAGMGALSDHTMIADEQRGTYAIDQGQWCTLGTESMVKELPVEADDGVKVEIWRYDPRLLASEDRVDRLSLYLSLKDDPDERVQGELDELLGGVQWSEA